MATRSSDRPDPAVVAAVEPGGWCREPIAMPRRRAVRELCAVVAGVVPLAWPNQAHAVQSHVGQARPVQARREPATALAAAWQEGNRHFVGILAPGADSIAPLCRQPVPTRAHGVAVEAEGTVLVVARRPGDWLARFDPGRGVIRDWFWSDGEHCFNGHVVRSADGRRLFTTETSLETGEGSVGVRDPQSLALVARWPTGGRDPHELLQGPDGALWVANGGLETRPETGRVKHHVDRMDSSLVRLEVAGGRMTGQWRLEDRRLGLRHLALAGGGVIAVALQAEHDDPQAKEAAPVLALWDRRRGLRAVDLPPAVRLSGYGGSVAASGPDVEVSCPRCGLVARWRLSDGECGWQAPLPLAEACAMASGWHGGAGWAVRAVAPSARNGTENVERWPIADAIRLDNHWAVIGRSSVEARSRL